jgi:hypothetical protein
VHSNEQIIAAVESAGSSALQFSQVGLSSSMAVFSCAFVCVSKPPINNGSNPGHAGGLDCNNSVIAGFAAEDAWAALV